MDRARRQMPIIGRPSGNILARKALKKAKARHAKALKSVKASTDNAVPKSMTMKHLKLRLNTRSQRVRKFQLVMEENERMLGRIKALGDGHKMYNARTGRTEVIGALNRDCDRSRGSMHEAYHRELDRQKAGKYCAHVAVIASSLPGVLAHVDNLRIADRLSQVTPSVFGHRTTTKKIVQKFNAEHSKLLEKLKREPPLMLPQWKQKRNYARAEASPEAPRSPSPMFMSGNRHSHSRNISFSSKSSRSPSPIGFLGSEGGGSGAGT